MSGRVNEELGHGYSKCVEHFISMQLTGKRSIDHYPRQLIAHFVLCRSDAERVLSSRAEECYIQMYGV